MRARGQNVGRAGEAVAVGGLLRADDFAAAVVKSAGKDKGNRKIKGGRGGDAHGGVVAAGPAQAP